MGRTLSRFSFSLILLRISFVLFFAFPVGAGADTGQKCAGLFANDWIELNTGFRLELMDATSINPVFKVYDAQDNSLMGIYKLPDKPREVSFWRKWIMQRNESPIEKGGLIPRSIAAYKISELLGLQRVPYSVAAKTNEFGRGLYMDFLHDAKLAADVYKRNPEILARVDRVEAQKFLLYDLLLQAQDRSMNNWMINDKGQIGIIDNDRILLNTDRPVWISRLNLQKTLPQALGPVDPQAAKMILNTDPKQLADILRDQKIEDAQIKQTLSRLEDLRRALLRGRSMEELYSKVPAGYLRIKSKGNELLLRWPSISRRY